MKYKYGKVKNGYKVYKFVNFGKYWESLIFVETKEEAVTIKKELQVAGTYGDIVVNNYI